MAMMTDKDMSDTTQRVKRGRPALDPETREARIFDALEHVVSESGLLGTTMNAVARAAGMSKRTLYTLYDGRDALIEAWVRHMRTYLVRPLSAEARALPLADRLHVLLKREAQFCLADRRLAVLRAMIAEAPRNRDLARAFYREGAAAAKQMVADELRCAVDAAELAVTVADVDTVAAILFDMVHQNPLDRLINPDACPLGSDSVDTRLDLAITIFLHGAAANTA